MVSKKKKLSQEKDVSLDIDKLADYSVMSIMSLGLPLGFTDYLKDVGKETETVRCPPNNEPRKILKDPSKAFELYHPEWNAKFNTNVDFLNQLKVGVGVDIQKKIDVLFSGLNAINGTLQQAYNAAYRIYHATPCNDESLDDWKRNTQEVIRQGIGLAYIQVQLGFASASPNALEKAIEKVSDQVSTMIDRLLNPT